jgi:acetolactate synthase-1/2/3 large subunit
MNRPILILGAGIQGCRQEAIAFAERNYLPVCLTWGAADLMPWDHPLRVGTFGTHGNRYANFAIQNADFVLSMGSRLDTKATGSPVSSFAPKARVVMVDIDPTEIQKFKQLGREVQGIVCDAKDFAKYGTVVRGNPEWLAKINGWKSRYPQVRPEHRIEMKINPYAFIEKLSDYLSPDDVIVSDTGCSLGWMMQAFKFNGQRFIHAFNNTPMGYGLPAAVGSAFATGSRVVLVVGDGGLSVNITELATVARHFLPLKIILFNNRGHAMCRQTQRQWLNGEYPATSYEGGLACPNYRAIAQAYGLQTFSTDWAVAAENFLKGLLKNDNPGLLELEISPEFGIEGQVRFGKSLEDADPALPREELAEIMEAA